VEIEKATIKKYLRHVTAYMADEGGEPDDVTGYYEYIIDMRKLAVCDNELDILLLGIDYMLLHPQLYTPYYETVHYTLDADEMEELLQYIRSIAYPDALPLNPETVKDVRIVDVKTTVQN
jgi:hypothetical protein